MKIIILLVTAIIVIVITKIYFNKGPKIEVLKYTMREHLSDTPCPYKKGWTYIGAYACRTCKSHIFQDKNTMTVGCKFKFENHESK